MYSELYIKILGTAEFQLRPGNLPDNIFGTRHHIIKKNCSLTLNIWQCQFVTLLRNKKVSRPHWIRNVSSHIEKGWYLEFHDTQRYPSCRNSDIMSNICRNVTWSVTSLLLHSRHSNLHYLSNSTFLLFQIKNLNMIRFKYRLRFWLSMRNR